MPLEDLGNNLFKLQKTSKTCKVTTNVKGSHVIRNRKDLDFNGRRIYPFNKGLRIYGGVYHPFDTLKKCTFAYDMNLKLYS